MSCRIIVGWKQPNEPIYATYGFTEPMTPLLLRRLARALEFTASNWLDETAKEETSTEPAGSLLSAAVEGEEEAPR
jgi:hypothetical protein